MPTRIVIPRQGLAKPLPLAFLRERQTGAANTALVVTLTPEQAQRVNYVAVAYSAAPTQGGVTAEMDAADGPEFDTVLMTGAANARFTLWLPESPQMVIVPSDGLRVTAPAGGAGITASVTVVTEEV